MAFEITWEDVKNTAKAEAEALESFTAAQRTLILDETTLEVPETFGDGWTQILRRYWAAHIAVQSTLESAGEGAFTAESIDGISSSKNQPVNNPSAKEGDLETQYGRAYFKYREKFKARKVVAFGVNAGRSLVGFATLPPP